MAASVNWGGGPFCGRPCNKSPTIWGSILGTLVGRNFHIGDGCLKRRQPFGSLVQHSLKPLRLCSGYNNFES